MSAEGTSTYRYIAYIDEAGDDGLRRVRPIDESGASEWLVLSAVVVRASNEGCVLPWVKVIKQSINHRQTPDIHFSKLGSDDRRLTVCKAVADLNLRCFVVLSNKKNMRGYVNRRAEKVPARNWFYCWVARLLLERVTMFCAHRNAIDKTPLGKVKFEFSTRGGMSYSQFKAYLHWIKLQSRGSSLYLDRGDLDWSVVDTDLIDCFDPRLRAGLQLADVVASAFYRAVDINSSGTCNPDFAKALSGRMWAPTGKAADFGVKAMPSPLWRAKLRPEQSDIFQFYGYKTSQIRR